MLVCDKLVTRHKGKSELEMTLENCKTTPEELVGLMTQYNRDIQKEEGPTLMKDVCVNGFYMDNKILGRNKEHSAYYNPLGIYFWGIVNENNVVFELPKKNKTKEWLLDFCLKYSTTRNQG
jgi:hypothetical protein